MASRRFTDGPLLQMKKAKFKHSVTALRTVCVPRMKVSRERHMGNRTRLQFRLSTEADALLMHRPSCETHIFKKKITSC